MMIAVNQMKITTFLMISLAWKKIMRSTLKAKVYFLNNVLLNKIKIKLSEVSSYLSSKYLFIYFSYFFRTKIVNKTLTLLLL